MSRISRREMLTLLAAAPALPRFLTESAQAVSAETRPGYDGPIVVVVRMTGGNDGLNTVIPFRDDRYFKARPTIAIPKNQTIPMAGGDLGLNPGLSDFRALMEEGHAAIVQGVGYPNTSRLHTRSQEIFETASTVEPAPAQGWLGRYLDHQCECGPEALAGVHFAEALGTAIASKRSKAVANPAVLAEMKTDFPVHANRGSRPNRIDYLQQIENEFIDAAPVFRQAAKGTGGMHAYPESRLGQGLRWTGNMIEAGCPTRIFYLIMGSFDEPVSPTFDLHNDQLVRQKALLADFSSGLRAFARHMKKTGQFHRVLLLTYSDFGRSFAENRDGGTEHGDASVLFVAGGKVRPGLLGEPADLGSVIPGAGVEHSLDFRRIYANILGDWLKVEPGKILGEPVTPFEILA